MSTGDLILQTELIFPSPAANLLQSEGLGKGANISGYVNGNLE